MTGSETQKEIEDFALTLLKKYSFEEHYTIGMCLTAVGAVICKLRDVDEEIYLSSVKRLWEETKT